MLRHDKCSIHQVKKSTFKNNKSEAKIDKSTRFQKYHSKSKTNIWRARTYQNEWGQPPWQCEYFQSTEISEKLWTIDLNMVAFLHHQDTTIDLILIFLGFSKANLDLIKACTCGCGLWVMTETEVAQTQSTQKSQNLYHCCSQPKDIKMTYINTDSSSALSSGCGRVERGHNSCWEWCWRR